ncbi:MAG: NAD-dependent epimerase/dehydratase family protein [Rhodobacteraceae bacterium]|nr:NAD-dependent epimerase/dehydratase family protein [Paracoccaceae bacterium]
MVKVSVIGGSGFIGSSLCRLLAERQIGFEIVDLKPSRSFPERSIIADIRDPAALAAAVRGDVIVHLAAVHRDDVRDPDAYRQTNVQGTANICDLAAARGIRRIVFTSTVAVHGFAAPGTDETGPIAPFNDYGRTKAEAEAVIARWQAAAPDRAAIVVRPTVVFGPGNRGNVFNLLSQIASGRFVMVGRGQNTKSVAYVDNVAAFLLHALTTGQGHSVHIYTDGPDLRMDQLVGLVRERLHGKAGTGPRLPYWLGLAMGHLADLVARVTGRRLPVSAIRVRKFCATTSFASANPLPGFVPPHDLRAGLEQVLQAEFLNPDPDREIFLTE